MAKINLLPWREELREQKQKEFIGIIGLVALLSGFIVWLGMGYFEDGFSHQSKRNAFLKQEMAVIDAQISEIKELRDNKAQLLERMELIQALQGNRPIIVRVFDELVKTLPDDLYYTSMIVDGNSMTIEGKASSNNRVAALMRNLDNSDWFENPNLGKVRASKNGQFNDFEITLDQVAPNKEEADDE